MRAQQQQFDSKRSTVNDNTAPVITAFRGDLTVQCAGDVPAANDARSSHPTTAAGPRSSPTATKPTPGSCANKFVLKRTSSPRRFAANTNALTTTITVNDNTVPGNYEYPRT